MKRQKYPVYALYMKSHAYSHEKRDTLILQNNL